MARRARADRESPNRRPEPRRDRAPFSTPGFRRMIPWPLVVRYSRNGCCQRRPPLIERSTNEEDCPTCTDRLPFSSEVVLSEVADMYRPGDRLSGRGLDGSTHAPLISLPARLPGSRLGHQIQGASINPFHATPQSRTRLRSRPRSPLPQAGYRTLSRGAGRSRQFARACSPTRRRVRFCAIAATPF